MGSKTPIDGHLEADTQGHPWRRRDKNRKTIWREALRPKENPWETGRNGNKRQQAVNDTEG